MCARFPILALLMYVSFSLDGVYPHRVILERKAAQNLDHVHLSAMGICRCIFSTWIA